MTLADSAGRSWQVLEVVDRGVVGRLAPRIWRFVLKQSVHRIDQRIVEVEPQPLARIKDRVVESIRANPDDWRDDEAIAGEAGPPRDEGELLDELEAAVRRASSVPEIIDTLYGEALSR